MLLTHRISQIQLVGGSDSGFGLGPFICPFSHFSPWIFVLDKNLMWGSEMPDLLGQASMLQEVPSFRNPRSQALPWQHRIQNGQQSPKELLRSEFSLPEISWPPQPWGSGLSWNVVVVSLAPVMDWKNWLTPAISHTARKLMARVSCQRQGFMQYDRTPSCSLSYFHFNSYFTFQFATLRLLLQQYSLYLVTLSLIRSLKQKKSRTRSFSFPWWTVKHVANMAYDLVKNIQCHKQLKVYKIK